MFGVLIFSDEGESSGSYRVETPGSNTVHGYDFFISVFSLLSQVVGHSVLK